MSNTDLYIKHLRGIIAELENRKSVLTRVLELDFLDDETIEAQRMDLDSVNDNLDTFKQELRDLVQLDDEESCGC